MSYADDTMNSNVLRERAEGLKDLQPGDVVKRIWGSGVEVPDNETRVFAVDDTFVYCDAMRRAGETEWEYILGPEQTKWKFDLEYGVETDEEMGWGVQPYGSRNIILTRIEAS